MYRDLMQSGWKHKDIDEMDINHFMQVMGSDESSENKQKKSNGKLDAEGIEDWFKKI